MGEADSEGPSALCVERELSIPGMRKGLNGGSNPLSWGLSSLGFSGFPDFVTHQKAGLLAQDLCVWTTTAAQE